MAQPREGSFHPSSPHSSSGGAESFKGTPDTRLTAFSPDENSAKSSKFIRNIGIVGHDTTPVRFPVSSYRGTASQVDKDPFLTAPVPSALSTRPSQKLSPTASAFQPFLLTTTAVQARDATAKDYGHGEQALNEVSSDLSTDMGLSRCLVMDSASRKLSASDLEVYLSVSCP